MNNPKLEAVAATLGGLLLAAFGVALVTPDSGFMAPAPQAVTAFGTVAGDVHDGLATSPGMSTTDLLATRDSTAASRSIGRIPMPDSVIERAVVTPLIEDPFQDVDIQVWVTEPTFGRLNRDLEQATETEFAAREAVYVDLKFEVGENNWVRVAETDYWLPMAAISLTAPPPPRVTPTATAHNVPAGSNRALGQAMAAERGWTGDQWYALERLWTRESNWNHLAANPRSTARGIPQKMMSVHYGHNWASSEAAAHWMSDPTAQITWGLNYIGGRHGSPVGAWNHFLRHGWY